jgi:uncharacterized protein YecA (UPF0149 family)
MVDDTRHLVNFFVLVKDDTNYDENFENAISELPKMKLKVGRNDPCPFGSGNKYKRCCGT